MNGKLFIALCIFAASCATPKQTPSAITVYVASVKGNVVTARYSYMWFRATCPGTTLRRGDAVRVYLNNDTCSCVFKRIR